MIYHLKTLTPEDFDKWTKALRYHKTSTISNSQQLRDGQMSSSVMSESEMADQAKMSSTVREGLGNIDVQINNIRKILDTMGNMIGESGSASASNSGSQSPSSLSARFNFKRTSSKSLSSPRPPQLTANFSSSTSSSKSELLSVDDMDPSQLHFKLLSVVNQLKAQRDSVAEAFDNDQSFWLKIYQNYQELSKNSFSNRDNGFTIENDDLDSSRDSLSVGKRTASFISYRTSNHSEIFFDAEEIVLSDDDADYALAENDIIDENEEDEEGKRTDVVICLIVSVECMYGETHCFNANHLSFSQIWQTVIINQPLVACCPRMSDVVIFCLHPLLARRPRRSLYSERMLARISLLLQCLFP
jgi:hypothetical protein